MYCSVLSYPILDGRPDKKTKVLSLFYTKPFQTKFWVITKPISCKRP